MNLFLTLTIFNNGTFVIEIIEDLESINFGSDLYSTFSCVKDKIYPLINQEKNNRQRQYQLYGNRHCKNIRDVSRQINRIIKLIVRIFLNIKYLKIWVLKFII